MVFPIPLKTLETEASWQQVWAGGGEGTSQAERVVPQALPYRSPRQHHREYHARVARFRGRN